MKIGMLEVEPRKFIRNNTTFSTILLIPLLILAIWIVTQIYKSGQASTISKIKGLDGGIVTSIDDIKKAIMEDKRVVYLENDKGDSTLIYYSGNLPEAMKDKSKWKAVGATNLTETSIGVAYEVCKVWKLNGDILATPQGMGIGASYDITNNLFIGGGAFYNIEDESSSSVFYGGFRIGF